MFFANPLLLLGLFAVLVPLTAHFLSRRRYDEVDWGAVQFLRLAPRARRRVFLNQWLLLALRMAALALLAVALSGPSVRSTVFNRFEKPSPRTTVILIDASESMRTLAPAREWAARFIDFMRPSDRVAVFAVKGDIVPLLAHPMGDREAAKASLELLPQPRGSADWPAAVEYALRAAEGDVLILTDGQRFGWADENALARWEALARTHTLPRIWVANVAPDRTASDAPALITFAAIRPVVTDGSEARFEGAARVPAVKVAVNGKSAGELPVSPAGPFSFTRKLPLGSHLVSVSATGVARDVAVDVVPPHPVLIVGDNTLGGVLSPMNDPTPAFAVRTIPVARFTPTDLTASTQVLVLSNVEQLTPEQDAAVESFAANGGGVFVLLGGRTDASAWNRVSHRGGKGWLPAAIGEQATGDAKVRPSDHPTQRLFRDPAATFPRHWRLAPDGDPILSLTNGAVLLAEKPVGRGRVVVSAAPFDASWDSNLIRLPDFVPLVHELGHYLAGGWLSNANLTPGEPILFRPRVVEPPGPVTIMPPDGVARSITAKAWPVVFDVTHDPGQYRVTSAAGQVRNYVVRPDPREADLTPSSAEERARVAALLGTLEEVTTPADLATRSGRGPKSIDFGDALLVLVLALFAAELWYARRTPTGA